MLRARLQGGILNKARRGELPLALPVGLVHDAAGRVVRDPDARVRTSVELFFETFRRVGSASAVVTYFRAHALLFPRRACASRRCSGRRRHPRTSPSGPAR